MSSFTVGQWGPDTFRDASGNTRLIGATVTAAGYVCAIDPLGNMIVTGPIAQTVVLTVTPAAGPVFTALIGPVGALQSDVTGLATQVGTNTGAVAAETARAVTAEAGALQKASNLTDVASPSAARTALGLGTAATQPSTAFDATGAAASAQAFAAADATSKVAAETTRATGAEATLTTNVATNTTAIASEITNRGTAVAAEATARASADAAALAAANATYATVVVHGAVAGTTRPAGAVMVQWVGTVQPTNAATGDIWQDQSTTPYTLRAFNGTSFSAIGGASLRPTSILSSVALANTFEPRSGLYNAKASNTRRARAAFAAMKNGERSMQMVVGYNSIAFGSNSTPAWQKGFVARFRSQLDSKYGAAGTGILYPIDTVMADETRVVESGTAWAFFGRGAFNVGARQGVTGSVLTVGPVVCDSFDFNAISGGGSTVTVAIDGGAAQTFTITANGENFTKITKAAGALGSHTAVLTVTAGNFYSVGPEGTATTSPLGMGVRVSRFAKGGTYLGVQAAANNPDTIGSQTTDDSLTTLFGMSQPDLAIFIPGTNEYFQQITQAQYTTGLTTLVTRARAVNSDVLFLSTVPPQSALAVPMSTYNATLYAVADSLNVPVLDITDRWQDYNTSSVAPYLFYADGNHPTDRGHWDLSDALAKAVDLILGSP